jgi:4-amino-4-deoxy-L-arabinose transferase-like glycosyltransferase
MKKYWLLIVVLLLGAFFRLYQLGTIPNALTWDETALGYNAYSILKTGKDEFGKFMPIIFKSFGDYKPGLYVYLAVPSVAIFGLNEFAVRLPGALFGILAIFGVYLLSNTLFPNEKIKVKNWELNIGHFSAFTLAIMPLHIHFSRGAWETNVFSTLLLFAIYFLIMFIKTGKGLNYSILLALLTLITYQAAKILTPLAILLTIIVFWKDFYSHLRSFFERPLNLFVAILSAVVVLSIFISSSFGDAGNRLKRLSIFSYQPKIVTDIFHNRPQLMVRLISERYLNHLSPKLLFYEGTTISEKGHFPGLGVLQPFDFVAIVLGFAFLAKLTNKNVTIFLIGLLLLSPIPGSLTLSEFSTVRSFFMVIPLSIIVGLGLFYAFTKIKPLFILISLFTLVTSIYMSDLLFVHANFTYAKEFQYGYREAIKFINKYPDTKTVMTDVYGQPYIYYLFYSRYNPATYQKQNAFVDGGMDVGRVTKIDKVEFHQFDDGEIASSPNTIYIGSIGNIKNEFNYRSSYVEAFETISYPDGQTAFRTVKTKAE